MLIGLLFLVHTIATRNKTIITLSFTKEIPVEASQRKKFLKIKTLFGISQILFYFILSIVVLLFFNEGSNYLFMILLVDFSFTYYIQQLLIDLTSK